MLQLIAKIALMISGFCIFAAFITFLLFRVKKATKIALVFEIIAFISGAVAVFIAVPFISFIKILTLFIILWGIMFFLLAPLGQWFLEIWEEEDKLDTKLKGNHYERHD